VTDQIVKPIRAADSREPRSTEPFRPGSMFWEEAGDLRFLLVLPGALLMQVMHPAVGSAVGELSVYKSDPWGRLVRSLDSMMLWVYGGSSSLEEGRRLRALHRPIRGVDNHGRAYRANDWEPYAWVHGVAFERLVTLRRVYGTPLSQAEEDSAYEEVLRLGAILRIPASRLPASRSAYWSYFHDMVANHLENHPTAREVLASMRDSTTAPPIIPQALSSLWTPWGKLTGSLAYWLTVATLPQEIRDILELRWSVADEALFNAFAASVRSVVPKLPESIRYHPYAHRARMLEREHAKIAARASTSLA